MGEIEDAVERAKARLSGDKPEKRKPGRPTKYDAAVHPALIESDPRVGAATWTDIAAVCGVSESTVRLWAEEHPEFSASVTHAKDRADNRVVNAFYKRALGDHKNPPDTKACIVWLGNRRPQEWRESQRIELTGKDGGPIAHADATRETLEAYAREIGRAHV